MSIDWDVPIPMDDGVVLRADLFRPLGSDRYPVILTYGPYGKGLAFQEGNKAAWDRLTAAHPEVASGSSNEYQNWEVVDPEKWVPDGYAVVRVDSRGAGRSPGFLDIWSPRETRDLYACIEWAGTAPWSNGNVGLNGISYYAMNQWWVAALKPPHLTAMCAWEGAADYYRDVIRHGGIFSQFLTNLYPRAVLRAQHGLGSRGLRSQVTGDPVSGPETLSEEELARNRVDIERWMLDHPLDDAETKARSADWERVTVPFLSAANWGGQGLHPRGNFEAFMRAAANQKWLEVHGGAHWEEFYTVYGETLQRRFFGHFLKGEDTGWSNQPPVLLQVRHVDRFVARGENEWPLARTRWTRFYLDPDGLSLSRNPAGAGAALAYDPQGEGVTFATAPLAEEIEITGPLAARLFLSSQSTDADIFLVLRVIDPTGKDVVFQGSNDPRTPIGLGWLRASHRKLDAALSLPYRPYHTHDEPWPLKPGKPVQLDIEIWPTSIVVPVGYRIALSVRGKDFAHPGPPLTIPGVKYSLTGVGPFRHDHPLDRPKETFAAENTFHFGPEYQPFLLLPVIPIR